MNCLIDNIIIRFLKKGEKIEAIKNYIEQRYRITIDIASIKKRIQANNINYEIN